jgi:DNA gyrase inhibitor GyrI
MWPSSACRWTTRLLRRLKTAATTSVLPSRKSAAACSKSSRGHTAAALPQPNTSECGPRGFSIRDLESQEIAAIHCVGDLAYVDRAWHYLYRMWLPSVAFEPADLPAMEIFVRLPEEIGWETFDLQACIPVARL